MSAEVSVIIPAFNAGPHIANAINSVLAQSYSKDIEIIVIDDGSTDNTTSVVSDISRQHKQIIYLPNERKKGPSGARNTGLLKASGKYVAFLDADDLWLPNHLMEGINFLDRHNDIDVVLFNFNIIEHKTKKFISDWFTERSFSQELKSQAMEDGFHLICDDMFTALINESFMHLQSMIVRIQVLRGVLFNEDIMRSEDRDLSIRLFLESRARFAYSDKITGNYYIHENSLTSATIQNSLYTTLDQIKIYTGYLEHPKVDAAVLTRLKDLLYDRYMDISYYYRKLNSHGLAVLSVYRSFWYGIGISQFRELAKIAVSFLISSVTRREGNKDHTPVS